MGLAVAFAGVVVLALAMLLAAMYGGGGIAAVRGQRSKLSILALGLVAIAVVIYAAGEARAGLPVLAVGLAAICAVIAGAQAHALVARQPRARQPTLALLLWIVAGIFVVIALGGVALLLA